jgi:hypothetical protein
MDQKAAVAGRAHVAHDAGVDRSRLDFAGGDCPGLEALGGGIEANERVGSLA